jgi:hypothetical protein
MAPLLFLCYKRLPCSKGAARPLMVAAAGNSKLIAATILRHAESQR